jgi:hypothetical protein
MSPNPRPEGDSQVVFTTIPAETSSGEPRRLKQDDASCCLLVFLRDVIVNLSKIQFCPWGVP